MLFAAVKKAVNQIIFLLDGKFLAKDSGFARVDLPQSALERIIGDLFYALGQIIIS